MPAPEIVHQLVKQFDRLVYELSRKGMIYGLTEEEGKVVEGE